MNIKIGDYRLRSDSRNYIVSSAEKKRDKKGNEFYEKCTYHPSIENAISNILQRRLKKSEATSIGGLLKEIKNIRGELKDIFKETI